MTGQATRRQLVAGLRATRLGQGLNARIIASRMGCPDGALTIWRWENGTTLPTYDDLTKWAGALGLKIQEVENDRATRVHARGRAGV